MLAAEYIVLTLLVFSLGGWGLIFRSADAQPLREAGLRLLSAPAAQAMDERRFFAMLIAIAVWMLIPVILISSKAALAAQLGMAGDPLFPVVFSCLSGVMVLLVAGPFVWRACKPKLAPATFDSPEAPPVSFDESSAPVERRLSHNVRDGVRGFILAVLPVAIVLFATQGMRDQASQHSLLKLLIASPDLKTVSAILLAAVVLAPLVEELVFRVCLQGWLESFLRPSVAFVIVALGFSAVHGWPNMVPLIPLALVLGGLFYLTRSYVAVVITHALFNLTNVVLAVLTAPK